MKIKSTQNYGKGNRDKSHQRYSNEAACKQEVILGELSVFRNCVIYRERLASIFGFILSFFVSSSLPLSRLLSLSYTKISSMWVRFVTATKNFLRSFMVSVEHILRGVWSLFKVVFYSSHVTLRYISENGARSTCNGLKKFNAL